MVLTISDILDILENKALSFEEIARWEDKRPSADRNLGRLHGCHIAARAMRDLAADIRLKKDLQA
mgnify:CR=1 FL=1